MSASLIGRLGHLQTRANAQAHVCFTTESSRVPRARSRLRWGRSGHCWFIRSPRRRGQAAFVAQIARAL